MSNPAPHKKPDEPLYNPYETPVTEPFEAPSPKFRESSSKWVLLWTLLVPAFVANALFWTYFALDEMFLREGMRSYGMNFLIFMLTAVPLGGLLYGIFVGNWMQSKTGGNNGFLTPLAQCFFQPFWFFISVTAGCFVVAPIMDSLY
ncbi:MAG: hypothetical protein JNL67_04765 [Planctomycetaceae bacterium]|nr:hypothetical protein [Planctomycetaceae bacterium]